MNKSYSTIILLIILLVALSGAVVYFISSKPQKTANTTTDQAQQSQEVQTPTSTPKSSGSNWRTYRNEEYGFKIQYPQDIFDLVKITKSLPPDYKVNYDGVKLISLARASKLGKQECTYGGSGIISVCKAELEGGIEFIPINNSIQNLTSTIKNSSKTTVVIGKKQSIKYSIGAEGEGADYYYIPLNSNRTLVAVRFYRFDGFPKPTLFEQILNTLLVE